MIGIYLFNQSKNILLPNARTKNKQLLTFKKNRSNLKIKQPTQANPNPFMEIVLFPVGKLVTLMRCNSTMRTLTSLPTDLDRAQPGLPKKLPVTLTLRQTCRAAVVNSNTVIK